MPARLEPEFRDELIQKIGSNFFQACLFCGLCTAGCAYAGLRPDLDPRKFMRQIAFGLREEVMGSAFLWLCTICERCTIHCPMGVNMAEVVQTIRGRFGIRPPGDLMLQCRAIGGAKSQLALMARWLRDGLLQVDPGRNPEAVTYHDPCNLGRKEEVVEEPRAILRQVCADFRDMTPGGRYNYCCGSSGGALLVEEHEDIRLAMGKLKARQIQETGAGIVATACLNCHEQLEKIAAQYDLKVKVRYVHELVDRALLPCGG